MPKAETPLRRIGLNVSIGLFPTGKEWITLKLSHKRKGESLRASTHVLKGVFKVHHGIDATYALVRG